MKTVTLYEKNDVVWIDISRATKKNTGNEVFNYVGPARIIRLHDAQTIGLEYPEKELGSDDVYFSYHCKTPDGEIRYIEEQEIKYLVK